jgi:hypothetical protein
VPLAARAPSNISRDNGALRKRFHNPRSRSSRIPIPSSIAMNKRNCTRPCLANECA